MTLQQVLVRLLPGIFADPHRARKCGNCGQLVEPRDRVKLAAGSWFCSEACRDEYWADVTA